MSKIHAQDAPIGPTRNHQLNLLLDPHSQVEHAANPVFDPHHDDDSGLLGEDQEDHFKSPIIAIQLLKTLHLSTIPLKLLSLHPLYLLSQPHFLHSSLKLVTNSLTFIILSFSRQEPDLARP